MKILLIYPYCLDERKNDDDVRVVPLGVYYIGAVLKANHYEVKIVNWHAMDRAPGAIEAYLREQQADVIGFSILQANRWGGIEIAQIAKTVDPNVTIVFGGVAATFLWEHFLTHFPQIDYVVLGEGEYSFLELVKWIETRDAAGLRQIKGIAFRDKGQAIKTEAADVIQDLDALPNPARYFTYQHLAMTRGCAGKCRFCGSPRFWGPKVRSHSPAYMVEMLERLAQKGVRFFYFCDDTLTQNPAKVKEVCQKIITKNLAITWVAISRVNFINRSMLDLMAKAGCIQISYGVESGSADIRRYLNKHITDAQIKKAFSVTMRRGILARAYFIYGCPGESKQTIGQTIELMHQIRPLSVIFYILTLFPGTALYDDYTRKFGVTDDIWLARKEDILYFETDFELSQKAVLEFGQTLRQSFWTALPQFVANLALVEQPELYPTHSDFLSRLAMTFDHGDYAHIEALEHKTEIARKLYRKALDYHPHARAFLGLAILEQKKGAYARSRQILTEGLDHFPNHFSLNLCMAVSLMNMGAYRQARSHLLKFKDIKEAAKYIQVCDKFLENFPDSDAKIP
jgi:anaerobic magnesium-protoporphyrin IX monomethyl ester cyclase